jgi:hypothetical protein
MKLSKITAFLALYAGFSAFASGSIDNTPPSIRQNINDEPLLSSAGLFGGGYALWKQHKNALKNYHDVSFARRMEEIENPLYFKWGGRFYKKPNFVTPAPPVKPSLRTPLLAGTLMGLSARSLYKWYDSKIRNPYYPTK